MGIEIIKSPEYKIRKIREIKNYSQDYIAHKLGLSVRAYSKIETGETQLTIKRLNQIAEVLQVTPLDILGFDEKKLFNRSTPSDYITTGAAQVAEKPIEYFRHRLRQLEEELHSLQRSIGKQGKPT